MEHVKVRNGFKLGRSWSEKAWGEGRALEPEKPDVRHFHDRLLFLAKEDGVFIEKKTHSTRPWQATKS